MHAGGATKSLRFCGAAAMLILLSSCCSLRAMRLEPMRDRYKTYLMIGVGDKPKCCILPPDQSVSQQASRSVPVSVWLRSVAKDSIRTPVSNVRVHLVVVDVFGTAAQSATVSPTDVVTNEDGFGDAQTEFIASDIGVFQIRGTYEDSAGDSVSLSQNIIVLQ